MDVGGGRGGCGGGRYGGRISMNSTSYLGGVGFEATLYSRLPAGASSLPSSFLPWPLIHIPPHPLQISSASIIV